MRKWMVLLLLLAGSFLSNSLYSQDTLLSSDSAHNQCVIDFETGINNIILFKTTLKEVQKIYGTGVMDKGKFPWHSWGYVLTFTYYDIGLAFEYNSSCEKRPRIFKPPVVTEIRIFDSCKCKTIDGIEIGSTYADLLKAFNTDHLNLVKTGSSKGNYTEVYTYITLPTGEGKITFKDYNFKNESDFIVKEIRFYINKN